MMTEDIENIIYSEEQITIDAAKNWNDFWSDQLKNQPKVDKSALKRLLARGTGLELIYRIIKKELTLYENAIILEAGSGTGTVSIRLADGTGQLVMLDTSVSALKIARQSEENLRLSPNYLNGSIFEMPFKHESFDFIFNVGVIDHFGPHYRSKAVKELLRLVKKGGKAVIVTNDARGFIHEPAMKFAVKKNRWHFGFKDAIYSLKEIEEDLPDCKVREYSRGFISQFEFLRYFIPKNSFYQKIFYRIFCMISFPLSFLNIFPGQYRVTVIDKNELFYSRS